MYISPRFVLLLLILPVGSSDALLFKHFCKSFFLRLIFRRFCAAPPTPVTTKSPTGSPSGSPIQPPIRPRSYVLDDFNGISNAFSLDKGNIKINWDPLFFVDLMDVTFDVFVALGEYNYTNVLGSMSVPDLVDTFMNEPNFQHIVLTDTYNISVKTPFVGETHSLLVTAKVNGEYSVNTRYKKVVVATVSPHIRDEVNVVGVFFPTKRLNITLEDVPEGTEHELAFIGPVSIEAQNLMVGDYMTGFTSKLNPFARRIVAIIINTPSSVVLRVVSARIEEIFDELELDSSFEVSRTANGPGRRSYRPDSNARDFLGIGAWFNDNIIQPFNDNVIKPIGDFVTGIGENIIDFFDDGQFEDTFKYSFVDVDEEWELELSAETNSSFTATLGIKGKAKIDVSLNANIRVAVVVPVYVYVGVTADYSLGLDISASAGVEQEYEYEKDLWTGKKFSKVFMIGPVPVEIYAEPSLAFEASAKASLTVSTEFGVSAEGGTSIGFICDVSANPLCRPEVVPPFNDFDKTYPTIEGTAAFEAGAGIVLNLAVGLYFGLVEGKIGLRGGVDLNIAGGVTVVGSTVIPTVKDFELSFGIGIPLSVEFLYGAFEYAPDDPVWEKKWIIITLPSIELEEDAEHRCLLDSNGGASASFSLKGEPEYEVAFVENKVIGSDWYISTPGVTWSLNKISDTEASFSRPIFNSFSPEPDGLVTLAMQPKFPPFLKVVTIVQLDSLFDADDVECTKPSACDGDAFFDKLIEDVGAIFNSEIFLSQPPDPTQPPEPSTVYKFEDFMEALKKLQSAGPGFEFWLGDDCSVESEKAAFVNMAAFLGQAMRETIIYDACDENNWDLWRADVFKEPTSPPENLAALYPMSSGCGQLGQKYAEYRCDDECPQDLSMELTATTWQMDIPITVLIVVVVICLYYSTITSTRIPCSFPSTLLILLVYPGIVLVPVRSLVLLWH